jgi:hypothetical protein
MKESMYLLIWSLSGCQIQPGSFGGEKISCSNQDSNHGPSSPLPSNCSAFIFVLTCSMCEPFSYIFFVNCILLNIQQNVTSNINYETRCGILGLALSGQVV